MTLSVQAELASRVLHVYRQRSRAFLYPGMLLVCMASLSLCLNTRWMPAHQHLATSL
jgi:hypothetical protein